MHILLADDHVLFRDALETFINALQPDWVMDNVSDLQSAMDILDRKDKNYDLVMLDYRMPGMNGLDGIKTIIATHPDQKVAVISGVIEEETVHEALELGVCAYFPKTLTGKSLVKAIELVLDGERFVPLKSKGTEVLPAYYDDMDKSAHAAPYDKVERERIIKAMTKREKEVLHYLANGLSNKQIAIALDLRVATIKLHVSGICKKLGAENRTRAAILAHHYHLIEDAKQVKQA